MAKILSLAMFATTLFINDNVKDSNVPSLIEAANKLTSSLIGTENYPRNFSAILKELLPTLLQVLNSRPVNIYPSRPLYQFINALITNLSLCDSTSKSIGISMTAIPLSSNVLFSDYSLFNDDVLLLPKKLPDLQNFLVFMSDASKDAQMVYDTLFKISEFIKNVQNPLYLGVQCSKNAVQYRNSILKPPLTENPIPTP